MARLWTETFDAQSTAGWDTTNGTPTFTTTSPRRGAASLRCAPATAVATSITKSCYPADQDNGHVFLRAYVRVTTAPSARTAIMAWADNATGATGFMCIKMNTDRTLIAGGSGATTGTASPALTIGQWYRVEMDYDDATNQIKAYLDGTLWATVTGDLGGGRYARFGIIQAASGSIDFDDIAVNDTTGVTDNGLPGPQPIATSQALGAAGETSTARVVEPPPPPNFSTISDDFNDGIVGPVWSSSYGGVTETGGRARVPCTTDYAAYATAAAYTLTGSALHVRVFPAAAGGAVAEAWTQVLVMSATPGTDLVMEVDAVAGEVNMASRVAYWDAAAVRIPYDPVAHAWFRIREDAGSLYWETAPDGVTWTVRRTLATPAWGADGNLALQLITHRDGGINDFAEFDNVNVVPGGAVVEALGPAAEVAGAQVLAGVKRRVLGVASETAAGQAPGRVRSRALPAAPAAEAGQALAGVKRTPLGTAMTADAGRPLTGAKRTALTGATGSSAVRPAGGAKRVALGTAAAVEEPRPAVGAKLSPLGVAGTVAEARGLSSGRSSQAEPAVESATARAVAGRKMLPLPAATGADAAQAVAGAKSTLLGTATGAAVGQPVTGRKTTAAGTAGEASAAQVLASASGLVPVEEATAARTLGGSKTTVQGTAGEVGEARPVGRAKRQTLDWATEASAVRPLTGGRTRALAPAEDTSSVLGLGRASSQALPTTSEVSGAGTLSGGALAELSRAGESGVSRPVTGRKTQALAAAAAGEAAQPAAGRKVLPLGTAVATTVAGPVSGAKWQALSTASETGRAERLLIPGRVGAAEDVAAAQLLSQRKTRPTGTATTTVAARPVTGGKRATLAPAVDTAAVRTLAGAKRTVLAGAVAVAESGQLAGGARRLLGTASTVETALVGPQVRLTWASGQDQARPLTGRRQRPAEHLDASTSGPHLGASTSGPDLGTSTSGPGLASVTNGPVLTTTAGGPRLVATTTSGG